MDTTSSFDFKADAARWRSVVESAVDGIIVIGERGLIEAFNPGAERLFGYSESDVIGHNVNILMPSPYHEEHDAYLAQYLTTGAAKIIGIGREVKGRRKDGTVFPLHLSVGATATDDERKFTGIVHDLTARVELEERLRSSEARWRAVVESAVDAIVVIDAAGRVEAFNPAAERLFGYAESQVAGRNVNILMPSPHHEEHDGYLARYLTTREPRIIGIGREVTGRRQDGTTFPLHLSVGQMSLAGELKFIGILHDLTARVRIEEQMREQAALARLGEMAAVIAHEVKNPLAAIRGAIQVIGGRFPPDAREAEVTGEIIKRIDSLNSLMKDLLLFARPPQPRFEPVEIAWLLNGTVDLLRDDPTLARIRVAVGGSAPPVAADAGLLQIVFLNLLVNAAHAIAGEGDIRISVDTINSTCRVQITDTGPGILPEVLEKLFTPFFTTKARGTGLGLATAKRLVEAHHGRIHIECPAEGGTAVMIELPIQP